MNGRCELNPHISLYNKTSILLYYLRRWLIVVINEVKLELLVDKIIDYKDAVLRLEYELRQNLIELERETYNGLTWHEFLASIKEDIQVNDKMHINRSTYRLFGTYQISESVKMTVDTNIYAHDKIYRTTISYSSGRYTDGVPTKYKKEFDELVKELNKYKFERVSNKYAESAGLGSF
jgi:hypothetical protein